MSKKKINIGLDIGVASVGWSILDEENNLINYGSRLFPDAANEKGEPENLERRNKRSARRRLSRIKNRKRDLLNLFIKNNLIANDDEFAKILENGLEDENGSIPIIKVKAKGLKEKLEKNELLLCLYHYIHHRGYFYITEEDLKETNKLDNNLNNVKKYPTEIQLEFFEKNGYYKGMDENQNFSNIKWREEVEVFLSKQNLSEEFNKNYLSLFSRLRDFATGPGSKKSPTPYGLYRDKSGVPIGENLWDALIGKCTIYPEINRGGKNSPIAEVFNLLNDLNNIYLTRDTNKNSSNNFPDDKLSIKEKKAIFEDFNKSLSSDKIKKSLSLKLISKTINQNRNSDISENDISGYRTDKEKKPLITKLENTMTIAKWMLDNKLLESPDLKNNETLVIINSVFDQLARTSDLLKRIDLIKEYIKTKYNIDLSTEVVKKLVENVKGVMQTHSLSYKAMLEYIEVGIEYYDENNEEKCLNSQQHFSDNIINNRNNNSILRNKDGSPKKYIPKAIFKDQIISPTSKRSFIQTINVVNKIIKLYGKDYEINNIVIELAREKNDAEKGKWISNFQKNNEKEIDTIFKDNNIDNSYKNNLNSKTRLKLKLLKEQDYYDIYDGQKIDPIDVIQNPGKYHEEHIIPFSVCFIDSRRNKVVFKSENNKEKGNQTPYHWLFSKGKYDEFKDRVIKLNNSKKISNAKKNFFYLKKTLKLTY